MARIKDVAKLAGVSTATVSRTLTRPDLVNAQTRAAVQAAIAETGYTINQAARNLRQRKTGGIVAMVPNLANPFFAQILAGIADELRPAGLNLLVADTSSGIDLRAHADPGRADGLIVLDSAIPAEVLAGGMPAVFACEWIDAVAVPQVTIDNKAAAALAIAHLLALGHRRVAHVCGPRGNVLTESRIAGVDDAARRHALPAVTLYTGDFSLASGRAAAQAWCAEPPDSRATAVFCASDEMAVGFIGAVQRRGLAVPGDVSVIGFDDIELVDHLTPALTTIRQPRRQIGRQAARKLLERIEGKTLPEDVILPVELVLRESTAPLLRSPLTGRGA